MSGFLRPRNLAIGAGAGVGLLLFSQSRTAQKLDPVRNSSPPKTNAVANINERFSKAGGTEHGTPAVASKLGSADQEGGTHYYENNVAGANKKSGTPGKEQKHEGSPDANANAVDRKGQTGKEGSHGNLRDIKTSQVG